MTCFLSNNLLVIFDELTGKRYDGRQEFQRHKLRLTVVQAFVHNNCPRQFSGATLKYLFTSLCFSDVKSNVTTKRFVVLLRVLEVPGVYLGP